jgi:hypothetical protein
MQNMQAEIPSPPPPPRRQAKHCSSKWTRGEAGEREREFTADITNLPNVQLLVINILEYMFITLFLLMM